MEKFLLKFLTFGALLSLTACSGGSTGDVTGIDSYVVSSGSFTQSDANTISGLGSVYFVNVLNGVFSSNSIALKAQLDQSSNAIAVVMNSSTRAVTSNNGVVVTFTRMGASVTGKISVNGTSVDMDQNQLSFYVPSSLDLIIDVHNISATRVRVLIWRRDLTVYNSTNADIDTDNSADTSGPLPSSAGAGNFAGLILTNATVTGATIGQAKTGN